MVVAEAAQRLRLPLISKDGEIREEEIEKCSIMSRSSLDSVSSVTISSSSNSTSYTTANSSTGAANNNLSSATDSEPGVGGVPNRFLGITPAYLWQTQLQQNPLSMVCHSSFLFSPYSTFVFKHFLYAITLDLLDNLSV